MDGDQHNARLPNFHSGPQTHSTVRSTSAPMASKHNTHALTDRYYDYTAM